MRALTRALRTLHLATLLLAATIPALAAKPTWKPVSPAELQEASPKIDPAAPAEILFLEVDIDDRGYPQERKISSYVRDKVFDPSNVDHITRLSDIHYAGSQDRTEIYARLVLPEGAVRDFWQGSRKGTAARAAGEQRRLPRLAIETQPLATERFLAIAGVKRGAVLEYQIVRHDRFPGLVNYTFGQNERHPVRRFEYRARVFENDALLNRTFVTNRQGAELIEDPKAKRVTLIANDLPAVQIEPFSGPMTDHILTVFSCYEQSKFYLLPRSGKVPLPGAPLPRETASRSPSSDWGSTSRRRTCRSCESTVSIRSISPSI